MRNMIIAFVVGVIGTSMTACQIDSDATKGTKINYKNTIHDLKQLEVNQKGKSDCTTLTNIQIADRYVFEPGKEVTVSIPAHSIAPNVRTSLNFFEGEDEANIQNIPEGLNIIPNPDIPKSQSDIENNEYLLTFDGNEDVFSDESNFAKYTLTLNLETKDDPGKVMDKCYSKKEIEVYFIKSKTQSTESN